MQQAHEVSANVLEKKAIKAALQLRWAEAVGLNLEILEQDTKNLNAKIRLGRAYLQLSDYTKAKNCFKEVLNIDPINATALKNYNLAKDKKRSKEAQNIKSKSLIREPGTSREIRLNLDASSNVLTELVPGENLQIKIYKSKIVVLKDKKPIGEIVDQKLISKFKAIKQKNGKLEIKFVSKVNNNMAIKLLILSSLAVFTAERQEVKPYLKDD